MIIKMVDVHGTGRAVPMLHDDDGEIVPGQIATNFSAESPSGRPTFEVIFAVDGKHIRSE